MTNPADLSIEVSGFDADGVVLIPPTAPDFDALARPMVGRVADVALQLKPMLVILANRSARRIVAFSKAWRIQYADGRTLNSRDEQLFPESVCGDAGERAERQGVAPGAMRLEAKSIVIHRAGDLEPYYDQFLPQFVTERNRDLNCAVDLHIELDAVIFDDGTLLGLDQDGWMSGNFASYVRWKQTWYAGIAEALDAGKSLDEALAPVEAFLAEINAQMRQGRPAVRDPRSDAIWKQEAAADARNLRQSLGDDRFRDALKSSIRLEPFVIHRSA